MTTPVQSKLPAVTFSPMTQRVNLKTGKPNENNSLEKVLSVSNDASQLNIKQQKNWSGNFQGIKFTGLENVYWNQNSQTSYTKITGIAFQSTLQKPQAEYLAKSDSSAVLMSNDKTFGLNNPNALQREHERASDNVSPSFQTSSHRGKISPQDTVCETGAGTFTAKQSKVSIDGISKLYNPLNKHGNAFQGIIPNPGVDSRDKFVESQFYFDDNLLELGEHFRHVGGSTENDSVDDTSIDSLSENTELNENNSQDYALGVNEDQTFDIKSYHERSKDYYSLSFIKSEESEMAQPSNAG